MRILHFCEATQPRNLFFFSGYEPFDLLGQGDENWSLLVDRRKRAHGKIDDEPASLDLKETYENIVSRLMAATAYRPVGINGSVAGGELGLPSTRFRVDNIAFVSGHDMERDDRHFIDGGGVPQIELDDQTMRDLAEHSNSHYRVYKRIAYYDPRRDLGMLSFLRLAHQGPFTYIESAGTRLLPMIERLMNQYSEEPTADELAAEHTGPNWWRRLPFERRRQIQFVAIGLVLNLILPWIAALIQIWGAYGGPPKLDDDWEPKRPKLWEYLATFGIVALRPYHREKDRKKRRARVQLAKDTREWDYAPKLKALRVWQSRASARTRFESIDLLLLRRTNDLAVQEAFLQCLEEAGIDTTDFPGQTHENQGPAKMRRR